MTEIEQGDLVRCPTGQIDWMVRRITSRTHPLGVELVSGMTGRTRWDAYENLVPYRKASDVKGGWL